MSGLSTPVRAIAPTVERRLNARTGEWIRLRWNLVIALAVLAGVTVLWLFSLQGVNPDEMGEFGLLSVLPLTYYAALVVLTINVSVLVHRQNVPEVVFLLHIVLLIFIIHGTPQILYGTLRYSWAWKHLGIIDYIQRNNAFNLFIDQLPAYHNWPGFFALNAFLVDVAGLDSALSYAGWAPVFFNLIDLGALLIILRSTLRDRRAIWLAIWLFFATNWVGQDYFSPQATNYFLHLVILGVLLTWFKLASAPTRAQVRRWLRLDWLTSLVFKLFHYARQADMPSTTSTGIQRLGLLAIIIIVFTSISSSHQLTPLMTVMSVMALVVVQRTTIRGLPFIFAVVIALWLVFIAVPFVTPAAESTLESFGRPTENTRLIDLGRASTDQRMVAVAGRSLTIVMLGFAVLGIFRQMIHGYLNLAFLVLIAAPVSTLGMNTYGGEIIFRVYLFALPFVAFFVATLFYPTFTKGRSWITALLVTVLSMALLTGLLMAYYGKDRQFYFTKNEVAASQYLHRIAAPGSLIIEGSRNYPSQYVNYEKYTYVAIDREPPYSKTSIMADPVKSFNRWMNNRAYPSSYLIITRSQKAAVEMVGSMPDTYSLDAIEAALIESPRFQIIYRNPDAIIFTLDRRPPSIMP